MKPREHSCDFSTWAPVRRLRYRRRGHELVNGLPLVPLLKALFAIVAPGRSLPHDPVATGEQRQNWGVDQGYLTTEGDGIVISEYCGGAVAGETIDAVYTLFVLDALNLTVEQALDHAQRTLEFSFSATPALIDLVASSLLRLAADAGLERIDRAP